MFWKTVWRWRCKAGFLNKLSGKTWSPFIFCLIIPNFEVPCLSRGAKILTITRRESFHLKEPEQQQPLFARFKLLAIKYSSLNCNVTGALSVEGFSFVFLQTRSLLTCYTTPFFFSSSGEPNTGRTVPPTPTGSDRMFRRTCNTSDANFHHVSLLFVWACPARRSANNLFWKQ